MTGLPAADGRVVPASPRPAPCTCERCRTASDAFDESSESLIVEERLRISLDCLVETRRMARLVNESTGVPLFSDLHTFARFVRQLARGLERHLRAIKVVLPISATNLAAPDWKGER